jgi:hypothetical protein
VSLLCADGKLAVDLMAAGADLACPHYVDHLKS